MSRMSRCWSRVPRTRHPRPRRAGGRAGRRARGARRRASVASPRRAGFNGEAGRLRPRAGCRRRAGRVPLRARAARTPSARRWLSGKLATLLPGGAPIGWRAARRAGALGARLRARRATASTATASRSGGRAAPRRCREAPTAPRSAASATAIFLARDLINTPANDLSPHDLAAAAERARRRAIGAERRRHRGRGAGARLSDDARGRRRQRPSALPDRHALGHGGRSRR